MKKVVLFVVLIFFIIGCSFGKSGRSDLMQTNKHLSSEDYVIASIKADAANNKYTFIKSIVADKIKYMIYYAEYFEISREEFIKNIDSEGNFYKLLKEHIVTASIVNVFDKKTDSFTLVFKTPTYKVCRFVIEIKDKKRNQYLLKSLEFN